jgi:hypothetical protein
LTAHVGGMDGLAPFTAKEEASILKELRKKRQWPCFSGVSIQCKRYRSLGYHEKFVKLTKATNGGRENDRNESNFSQDDWNEMLRRLMDD